MFLPLRMPPFGALQGEEGGGGMLYVAVGYTL